MPWYYSAVEYFRGSPEVCISTHTAFPSTAANSCTSVNKRISCKGKATISFWHDKERGGGAGILMSAHTLSCYCNIKVKNV